MTANLAAPFPYFEWSGIEVRADGSIWRTESHGAPCIPRRIDNPDGSKGYRNVRLPQEGRWRTFKAHRIVWVWYHGPIPDGCQINHRNLIKDDNRIHNLEVVTPAGNIQHSYANGRTIPWTHATAWRGRPRITDATKVAMQAARTAGSTLIEIAAAFGCSVTHAQRITGRRER